MPIPPAAAMGAQVRVSLTGETIQMPAPDPMAGAPFGPAAPRPGAYAPQMAPPPPAPARRPAQAAPITSISRRSSARPDSTALAALNTAVALLFLVVLVGGAFAYQYRQSSVRTPDEQAVAATAEHFWAAYAAHNWAALGSFLRPDAASTGAADQLMLHIRNRGQYVAVEKYHVYSVAVRGSRATASLIVRREESPEGLPASFHILREEREEPVRMKFVRTGAEWKLDIPADGYEYDPFAGPDDE